MHESKRLNPKKDKSARRKSQPGWKKAQPTMETVYGTIERKLPDGRVRKEKAIRYAKV